MERQYFIMQNDQQTGPFTLEQLKTMQLSKDTKIWYQGLDSWKTIEEIPEIMQLGSYLTNYTAGNTNWQPLDGNSGMTKPEPPKTYLTEAILVTIGCCWPLGIPAIVYASKVEGKYQQGDYEGAEEASRQAKNYTQYSFWSGLVIVVLYILLLVSTGGRNF
jgi:hypothetical protein